MYNRRVKLIIKMLLILIIQGFPGGLEIRNLSQCRRYKFNPWVRKILWRRKWQPTSVSCLGNAMDRRAWWTTVHRITRV